MFTTEVQISKKRSEEAREISDTVKGRRWEISAEGYITRASRGREDHYQMFAVRTFP